MIKAPDQKKNGRLAKEAAAMVQLAQAGINVMNKWATAAVVEKPDRDRLAELSAIIYATSISTSNTPAGKRQAFTAALFAAYNIGKHQSAQPAVNDTDANNESIPTDPSKGEAAV